MPLLDAVAARLQNTGVATPGTNLFLGHLPSAPDTCLAIFLRGGASPVRTMGPVTTAPDHDLPTVQVMVRAATIPTMDALQSSILRALDHWWGTFDGVVIKYSELSYFPVDLGFDENARVLRSIVFNMKVGRV